jgi:hypothetical protein
MCFHKYKFPKLPKEWFMKLHLGGKVKEQVKLNIVNIVRNFYTQSSTP